mmetsp:Transcript_18140/g.20829  ORF Transcript_18140/g.20829 Transcript_18140/m.20829 type:complete len:561 (-) Transcript_18140:155-1837(-)
MVNVNNMTTNMYSSGGAAANASSSSTTSSGGTVIGTGRNPNGGSGEQSYVFFQKDMQRRPMYRDPVEEESHLTSAPMKEQKTPNFMPTTSSSSSSHVTHKPKRRDSFQKLSTARSLSTSSFIDLAVEVAVVPKRNVTFATTVELRFGISVKDMTAEEVLQTWMSTTEHNMVRKSCLKIIDAVEKFGGNPRTGKKLCVRGLEPHFTKQAKQNTINRKTTRQAVLSKCDDDYCNQDTGEYDMDLIKEAYQQVGRTSEFQCSAELKARQDRKEIEKYLFVLETTHPHLLQYPKYVPPPTKSKSVNKNNTQVKQNQNENNNNTTKFPTTKVGSENNLYNAYSKGNVVPESAPLPKSESAAALAAAAAAAATASAEAESESAPSTTTATARRSSSSWTSALAPKSAPTSAPASTPTPASTPAPAPAPVVSTPVVSTLPASTSTSASTSTAVPASKSKSTSTSKSTSALVSALLAASKSAVKPKSKANSHSTTSNNCCTTPKMEYEYADTKNNANTDAKANFTIGMEYEDDIKDENEEADSAFANNKKNDDNNKEIDSERSIHIAF